MVVFILAIIWMCIIYKAIVKFLTGRYEGDTKMDNKTVIVTGSNTGIGFETALDLAKRGAKVILACRDENKGIEAKNKIIEATGNNNVIFKPLDLSSFKSVKAFVEDIVKNEPKLDVLINNAGTGKLDNSLTADNLPIEAQVNHFSPFLLTTMLLPLLKSSAPSRIVIVSSVMHKLGTIKELDKQAKSWLGHSRAYSNTKLANVLFTKKLNENLQGTGVTVNCLHPGAVNTEIFRHQPSFVRFLLNFLFKTPEEGAQTSIYLAVAPELRETSGKYFVDCKEATPAKKARDDHAANVLWELSELVTSQKKNL